MHELISKKVKNFYETLPFNKCKDIQNRVDRIKLNALKTHYPDLDKLLTAGEIKSVLEVGCGTGWLSNTLGYNYDISVLGIDLTLNALSDAIKLRDKLRISENVKFLEADLFSFTPNEKYDLLVSIGALHHTFDTKTAFNTIEKMIRPGGFIYLGLYHLYSRKVFLKMFSDMVSEYGEKYAFDFFVKMSGKNKDDPIFLKSWFRDQIFHVHENQHTFEEVSEWLIQKGFTIISTSINRFEEIKSIKDIYDLEKNMEYISYKKNYIDNQYYPGFFTISAIKG